MVEIRELQVSPFDFQHFEDEELFEKVHRLDNGEKISAKVTDYHPHRHEPQTDGDAAIQEAAPRKEHKTQQRAIKAFIIETARGSSVRYAIVIIA